MEGNIDSICLAYDKNLKNTSYEMMTTDILYLPYEVLLTIFRYLRINDLLVASQVSLAWREAAGYLIARRVTLMITDDVTPALEVLKNSTIKYQNWVFKEIDLTLKDRFGELWRDSSSTVTSLKLLSAGISEREFLDLLQQCNKLQMLELSGLTHILMTGTLLSNPEDIKMLSESLKNVKRLHLACSRYLTDCLFTRIISVVGPLTRLSLAGCHISYQNSIRNRFYPKDGSVTASEHVLTFKHIMQYIEINTATITALSFGRTGIDSESLEQLSLLPGLQLTSIHLMSCEQLSNSGVQLLCQNQKHLEDLDLSLCSKITDHAVLAISQNLKNLKILILRRCNGITERGLVTISELKCLEKLDISYLENITSKSVEIALLGSIRPTLTWLNLAALQLEWSVVEGLATAVPNLTTLDLSSCIAGVSDKTVQSLCKSLVKLQTLYLNNCTALSDIGLAGHGLAAQDPVDTAGSGLSLESLGLKENDAFSIKLGSRAERQIRQEGEVRKYLEENIEQIVHSSEHGLSNLTGLQELNLSGCFKITDITLNYALKFQELQFISLSQCKQISEKGLVTMARNCPSLETVMLAECSQVSDTVILAFSFHLKRLKTLDVQRCILLTNDALDSLGVCHSLRYLDVSGCKRMTLEDVQKLETRIPLLHNLHHRFITYSDHIEEKSASPPKPPPLLKKLRDKFR